MSRLNLGFVVVFVCVSTLCAEPATQPVRLGDNAALCYWAAFAEMPQEPADIALAQQWNTIPLDQKALGLINASSRCLEDLHSGAQLQQCDWGLDLSKGSSLRIQSATRVFKLERLACLRTRAEFEQGHTAEALQDACDLLVYARHMGQEPLVIAKLMEYVMQANYIEILAPRLQQLDAPSLAYLQRRLAALPVSCSYATALASEHHASITSAIARIRSAGANPDWPKVFKGFDESEIQAVLQAGGGTVDGVVRQLQAISDYNDRLEALMALQLPQREFLSRAAELHHAIENNPLAKLSVPKDARFYGDSVYRTNLVLFATAVTVLQAGPDAIVDATDPINHEPIQYHKQADGFELTSSVLAKDGSNVKLVVGPSANSGTLILPATK